MTSGPTTSTTALKQVCRFQAETIIKLIEEQNKLKQAEVVPPAAIGVKENCTIVTGQNNVFIGRSNTIAIGNTAIGATISYSPAPGFIGSGSYQCVRNQVAEAAITTGGNQVGIGHAVIGRSNIETQDEVIKRLREEISSLTNKYNQTIDQNIRIIEEHKKTKSELEKEVAHHKQTQQAQVVAHTMYLESVLRSAEIVKALTE